MKLSSSSCPLAFPHASYSSFCFASFSHSIHHFSVYLNVPLPFSFTILSMFLSRPSSMHIPGRTRRRSAGATTQHSSRNTTRSKTITTTLRYRRSSMWDTFHRAGYTLNSDSPCEYTALFVWWVETPGHGWAEDPEAGRGLLSVFRNGEERAANHFQVSRRNHRGRAEN